MVYIKKVYKLSFILIFFIFILYIFNLNNVNGFTNNDFYIYHKNNTNILNYNIKIDNYITDNEESKNYISLNYYYKINNNKLLIEKNKLGLFYNDEKIKIYNFEIDNNIYFFIFSHHNVNYIKLNTIFESNNYILYKNNDIKGYLKNLIKNNNITIKNNILIDNNINNYNYDNYIVYNNENEDIYFINILNNKYEYDLEITNNNTNNIIFLSDYDLNKFNVNFINDFDTLKTKYNYSYFKKNKTYYALINQDFVLNKDEIKRSINFLKTLDLDIDISIIDNELIINFNDYFVKFKLLIYDDIKLDFNFIKNEIIIEKKELLKIKENNYNLDNILKKYFNIKNTNIIFDYDKNIIKNIYENNLYDNEFDFVVNVGIEDNYNNINKSYNLKIVTYEYQKDLYLNEYKINLDNLKVNFSSNLVFKKENLTNKIYQKYNYDLEIKEDDEFLFYINDLNSRKFTFNYLDEEKNFNVYKNEFLDLTYISYFLNEQKVLYLYLEKQNSLNKQSLYNIIQNTLKINLRNYDIIYNNTLTNDLITNIENSTNNFFENSVKFNLVNKDKLSDKFVINIIFKSLILNNKIDEKNIKNKLEEEIEKISLIDLVIDEDKEKTSQINDFFNKKINNKNIIYKINYIDDVQKTINTRFYFNKNNKVYYDVAIKYNNKEKKKTEKTIEKKQISQNNSDFKIIIIFSVFFVLINLFFVIFIILKKFKKI